MKILVLSLPSILFLGTFLEVDSSDDSDSSLSSLLYSSADDSTERVKSRAEGKEPIWKSLSGKFSTSGADSSRRGESSSGSTRRGKKPVKKSSFEQFDSADRAGKSTRLLPDVEVPIGARTFEELAKDDMRNLYHDLSLFYLRLSKNPHPNEQGHLKSQIERTEKKIIELKPELREAFGMNIELANKKSRKAVEAIARIDASLEKNEVALIKLGEKRSSEDKYQKLLAKQKRLRQRRRGLKEVIDWCEKVVENWDRPEKMKDDIVPAGMRIVS